MTSVEQNSALGVTPPSVAVKFGAALRMARSHVWLITDQAMVSGTNYVTAIVVARFCSKVEFGTYVLAVAMQMALREIQIALVTGPLAYLGAMDSDQEFTGYITPLLTYQLVIGVCVSLLYWVVTGTFITGDAKGPLLAIRSAGAGALFFIQAQEFFRRTLMARLLFRRAFLNDLLFCGLQLVAMGTLLVRQGSSLIQLSPNAVFCCAVIAGSLATCYGYLQIRRFIWLPAIFRFAPIAENWRFGRWNLASSLLSSGYQQAAYWAVGLLVSTSAVANLEGPRLLVAPFSVLMMGWNNLIGPSAARKFASSGVPATAAFLNRTTWALCVLIGVALLPLMLAPSFALHHLLGQSYGGDPALLRIWGVTILLNAISCGACGIFFAARRPSYVTFVRLAAALIGLPSIVYLTLIFRVHGAACARLSIEAVVVFLAFFAARRLTRQARVGRVQCLSTAF